MNILKKKLRPKKKNQILRFVKKKNYAENFGFQWNIFSKTQIDNLNSKVSKVRLIKQTNWKKKNFNNKSITLEAGGGAGRFSHAFLNQFSVKLVRVDLSDAVESNKNNNHKFFKKKKLFIFQADIANMPFKDNVFDKTFCFGVLQHTPVIKKTLIELIKKTKKGGSIVVDFYPYKGFWTLLSTKYILRPITKRMPKENLLYIIKLTAPIFYKIHLFLKFIGLNVLTRFLPICDPNTIPKILKNKEKMDWIILDTFDMFSAFYDQPQKIETVKKIFMSNKCKIEFAGYVNYDYGVSAVVRAIKY